MADLSTLAQGQRLSAVFGPKTPNGSRAGATTKWDWVSEILVGQLAGPEGYYDVAIIKYRYTKEKGRKPDLVIPLHMAQSIHLLREEGDDPR